MATQNTKKVDLKTLREFFDLEANTLRKKGDIFKASAERAKEIQESLKPEEKGKGPFVSIVEVKKQQPKK